MAAVIYGKIKSNIARRYIITARLIRTARCEMVMSADHLNETIWRLVTSQTQRTDHNRLHQIRLLTQPIFAVNPLTSTVAIWVQISCVGPGLAVIRNF